MISHRIDVTIEEISPPGAKVFLFGSFEPGFWMNQPTLSKYEIGQAGETRSFKGTDKIFVLTSAKGNFKLSYIITDLTKPEEPMTPWALYITIYGGFSMLFIALMYFEGKNMFKYVMKSIRSRSRSREGKV